MYWADSLADKLKQAISNKQIEEPVRFNAGLSVSGLQHVGRIRGEILISATVKKFLEEKGLQTEQYLTLYTQDEWKGKEQQLDQFPQTEEAEKYTKWPLLHVPDPHGCHEGWVQHFWEPFGTHLEDFVKGVETITTTQLYEGKMKPYVKTALRKKEEIRKILNKYRDEKLPNDWLLFNPICENCGKIGDVRRVEVFPDEYQAQYTCNCGNEGKVSLEQGKLAWRVEWAAIWSALRVDFESYGKDHAAPGGSRDTANEIAQKIFNRTPPHGTSYEWVAYKENKQKNVMSSSDFQGYSPKDWIGVANPTVLNYLYLVRDPMKQITLDLKQIPQYSRRFRNAEEVFFGRREEREEREEKVRKAYKYAFADSPPEEFPVRIPYSHAALFVQTVPSEMHIDEIIKRLQKQDIIGASLSELEKELLKKRLDRARTWVKKWAPERYQITLIDKDQFQQHSSRLTSLLQGRAEVLEKLITEFEKSNWTNAGIKDAMSSVISPLESDITGKIFKSLYIAFLGKERGPRIARYFSLQEKTLVLDRLRDFHSMLSEEV